MNTPEQPRRCDLDSCHLCTLCAASRHEACTRTVSCPTTRNVNRCRCCGGGKR